MKPLLFKWLTIAFTTMLLSSFLSMMAVFVGSEGGDLRDLIVLQAILIPAALATVAWCVLELVRGYGIKGALRTLWQHLPGWLLFTVLAANSLVLIAELSFLLIQHHTGTALPWQEHLPALTAITSSLALVCCYISFCLATGKGSDNPPPR